MELVVEECAGESGTLLEIEPEQSQRRLGVGGAQDGHTEASMVWVMDMNVNVPKILPEYQFIAMRRYQCTRDSRQEGGGRATDRR